MREIKVNELKEGMTTAVDVFSPKGQLILKRHQTVSAFDKNMPSLRKNTVIPSITCMNI